MGVIQESKEERMKRFVRIWTESRANAGKSQEFMASGLGISKRTVQNWEKGVSSPDLFLGSEWFRLLGINPLPYYLTYLFPELFENQSDEEDDEQVERAILLLIKNCTMAEKRQLLYLMAGCHGSPWYSVLQMMTAHCHTQMRSRVGAAELIRSNYEIDSAAGTLVCPDEVQPDMTMLENAIQFAKRSVIEGDTGYTTVELPEDIQKNERKKN